MILNQKETLADKTVVAVYTLTVRPSQIRGEVISLYSKEDATKEVRTRTKSCAGVVQ